MSESSITFIAEQSSWKKTGRYEEVQALCVSLEKRFPKQVHSYHFGTSPEGRPLVALVASGDGVLDPITAHKKKRLVVIFQACIHAGEVDGKDAGFWLLRDLLEGRVLPGILKEITVVFIPVFNVDGHERVSPHNRPNQNGPEETGWRVTAQNLNLNRDYTKADAPEMQAMLMLLNAWDPILYVDLHSTDGAKYQHDVAVILEPSTLGPSDLRKLGLTAREEMHRKLSEQGHLPIVEFYPSFNKFDNPNSGFSARIGSPCTSTNYWPLRNRFAALVETHSWKDYAKRVSASRDVMINFLELTAKNGIAWKQAASAADRTDQEGTESEIPLKYKHSEKCRLIEFHGYAYSIELSPISGQPWIQYDETKPEIWKAPFYEQFYPALTTNIPIGGYLVETAWTPFLENKLRLHGFAVKKVKTPLSIECDVFRATEIQFRSQPFEGRFPATVHGEWFPERRRIPAGSLYIAAKQRGRRLLTHLFEPLAPDSFLSWGFFNAVFEQKEHMEDYLAEKEARKMLAERPSLKVEFENLLKQSPSFAQDPAARLEFFYRRHPSWDERKNLYPIYRLQNEL